MPPFYCPFESARHPRASDVERRAIAWIDQVGFCTTPARRARSIATRSADFYARFAPGADAEGLLTAACWIYWGFAFDDVHCDEGPLSMDPAAFAVVAGRVQRALETPGVATFDDPFETAIHDLGERLRACATPVQVRRFVHAHRGWLSGVLWEIGNRSRGHTPTLDEYITMRLHTAGGEPTFALLEIANGLEVPASEMDSPAVCALTEMAIFVTSVDNDRQSAAKEFREHEAVQNILNVLMRNGQSSPGQAVSEAVALRDRVLRRFVDLRDRILAHASPALRRYLVDLGHGIRGNAEWGVRVTRYAEVDDAAAEASGLVVTEPGPSADHTSGPPPVATIAWWWDDYCLLPGLGA